MTIATNGIKEMEERIWGIKVMTEEMNTYVKEYMKSKKPLTGNI